MFYHLLFYMNLQINRVNLYIILGLVPLSELCFDWQVERKQVKSRFPLCIMCKSPFKCSLQTRSLYHFLKIFGHPEVQEEQLR